MAIEEWSTWWDKDATTPTKSSPLRRRNSPKSPDAEVALYDVTNNRFQKVKKRDAEQLTSQTVDLPRWSKKKDVFIPEPEDAKREYYLATLHLGKLGFVYNLQRHLYSACELYIVGL